MGRNTFFFLLIGGVVLVAVMVFAALRTFGGVPVTETGEPSAPMQDVKSGSETATAIVDGSPMGIGVRYTSTGFIPEKIAVSTDEGGLCLTPVVNETNESLILRLGPADKSGSSGPQYEAVHPGESVIIDPRFRIPEVSFFDFSHPERGSFSVALGTGCMLE